MQIVFVAPNLNSILACTTSPLRSTPGSGCLTAFARPVAIAVQCRLHRRRMATSGVADAAFANCRPDPDSNCALCDGCQDPDIFVALSEGGEVLRYGLAWIKSFASIQGVSLVGIAKRKSHV